MQRIASGSQVASFTAEADVGTPGHFARSSDAGGPTQFGKNWPERVQEEICSVIAAASIALDGTNNAQLLAAIRFLATGGVIHAVDTGAANAYVITPTPALGAYAEGVIYSIKFVHANTGASTLNVSGLGNKAVTRSNGSALQAGDIAAGEEALVIYDGTEWQLMSEILGTATSLVAGIVQLATAAETLALTNTGKAVTPADLGSLIASATQLGLVALATSAQTLALTDTTHVVTPADLGALLATTTQKGIVALATSAQTVALSDTTHAVTPASLASLFTSSLGSSGYIKFPGGFMLQWVGVSWNPSGVAVSTSFSWLTSFPTACVHADANDTNSIGGGSITSGGDIPIVRCAGTTTGGVIREDSNKSDTFSGTHTTTVFGIGY